MQFPGSNWPTNANLSQAALVKIISTLGKISSVVCSQYMSLLDAFAEYAASQKKCPALFGPIEKLFAFGEIFSQYYFFHIFL